MGNILIVKGNLFDAPKGSILAHACNAQGVWGSGIAKEFKKRCPKAFELYRNRFIKMDRHIGRGWLFPDDDYQVLCLITSHGYGRYVDPKEEILQNTFDAVEEFLSSHKDVKVVHSNKFNSGLFGVPWEETEQILREAISETDIEWIVYDNQLE